ncbi:BRO1-domain-containing protein [Panus rudis PR-1116 ss-1]|nr:BRO1-domain-containing protein [Panus rudis PR-1116 ss-1]
MSLSTKNYQSPLIAIPRKGTEEVDWTTPIRSAIAHSYGEDPDSYAQECAALQRCRQDAVKGAGSDSTARDLLYKYFGQLELLELRFPEIRVNFPWRDAFTSKLITQTSVAYEKASIIFQIAATHSSIAAQQNRSDPEGLKRAFYYSRTCAGMLTYINDNFLHAPSTDLSRDVVKFLVGLIMAQATEIFFEKCTDERKGNALVAKVAAQAAFMYTGLAEEVKEFMGKGIFDRNWVTIVQTKSKYFSSQAQYYRALADTASAQHGPALSRLTLSESLAKEAHKLAQSFNALFTSPQISPTLPPDAGTSLHDLTKAHLSLVSQKCTEASRENDLIYNAIVPPAETLPAIDRTPIASIITIQEVYASPDVQKVIGVDLFGRLVPLSVHESASVYSEEKAKVVRGESGRVEECEVQIGSALEALGLPAGLARFKQLLRSSADEQDGDGEGDVPEEVRRLIEDVSTLELESPLQTLLTTLPSLSSPLPSLLSSLTSLLTTESQATERARMQYPSFDLPPLEALDSVKRMRESLRSVQGNLDVATGEDGKVRTRWESVRNDVEGLILSVIRGDVPLEEVWQNALQSASSLISSSSQHQRRESLIDTSISDEGEGDEDGEERERERIREYVREIEERLDRLRSVGRERGECLRDLKEKVQTDDVSHLLLLTNNRRSSSAPNSNSTSSPPSQQQQQDSAALFASELEKFKPYQMRIANTIRQSLVLIEEVRALWNGLNDFARGRGGGKSGKGKKKGGVMKRWEEREKRRKEVVRRFERARDGYLEVRDGLACVASVSPSLETHVLTFFMNHRLLYFALDLAPHILKREHVIQQRHPILHRPRSAHFRTRTRDEINREHA